jgi:hypothetical protein
MCFLLFLPNRELKQINRRTLKKRGESSQYLSLHFHLKIYMFLQQQTSESVDDFMNSFIDLNGDLPSPATTYEAAPSPTSSSECNGQDLTFMFQQYQAPHNSALLFEPFSVPMATVDEDQPSLSNTFSSGSDQEQQMKALTDLLEQNHPEQQLTASQKKAIRESKRNLTCFNCKTTTTCLWRKSLDKKNHLCNPCSLYERQHRKPRPVNYKDRPARKTRDLPLGGVGKKTHDGYVTLHWSQLQMLLDMAAQSRFRRS